MDTPRERRRALIDRSDRERDELAALFNGLENKLAVVDTVVATARRLNRHRLLVGAAGLFVVLAPRAARHRIRRALWLAPLALEGFRLARAFFSESPRARKETNDSSARSRTTD